MGCRVLDFELQVWSVGGLGLMGLRGQQAFAFGKFGTSGFSIDAQMFRSTLPD